MAQCAERMMKCATVFVLVMMSVGVSFVVPKIKQKSTLFCDRHESFRQGWKTALATLILQSTVSVPAFAQIAPLADVGLKEYLVKDGNQFLRLGQPTVSDKNTLNLGAKRSGDVGKEIQENLELIRLRMEQVGVTNPSVWGQISVDDQKAESLFSKVKSRFITQSPDQSQAAKLIDEKILPSFSALANAVKQRDAQNTLSLQEELANDFSVLRQFQLPPNTLPYEIPEEYATLPVLKGFAEVDLTISSSKGFRLDDSKTIVPAETFRIVVDGYHAPLTAGNFIDLCDKKFYNGMNIQKAEELIVQTGGEDVDCCRHPPTTTPLHPPACTPSHTF